ncbi:hypothetical protein C9374_012624 [Naegleria lovaniensis]|uniref:Peptidase S53 domain-containing protein n=1 Tax=Naegleria lovaniensis TaxID=51637 RepID=A0AA88H3E0_NAELO|nr:uncharacterized protein C9374_012624 [Naegleria lovaniensis]KAG2392372.1 hypothetical protein C9374_012624 [Naegleria lovaniensis]
MSKSITMTFLLLGLLMMTITLSSASNAAMTNSLADDLLNSSNYVKMETERLGSVPRVSSTRTAEPVLFVPEPWKKLSVENGKRSTNENQMLHLTFALKNQNIDKLTQLLLAVSDPSSPQHENYLTMNQVAAMTSPLSEHKELVLNYIKSIPGSIIVRISKHENLVSALLPLSSVNKYLKADMQAYRHEKTGDVVFRSEIGYSLPEKLAQAVTMISGLVRFPTLERKMVFSSDSQHSRTPNNFPITPKVIWNRYNITFPATVDPKSSQAVASFLQQYYSTSDLILFQNTYGLEKQLPKLVGPNIESNPGVEASLDIQYLMGVGYKINTTFVSTPGINPITEQEPFYEWIVKQQEMGDQSPWVHSVSYGDIEYQATRPMAEQLDAEFIKFGVTGRTILIASGDNGSRCNDAGTQFQPEWPTSSPWVTSVGATTPSTESWWEESTSWSGGGFSNYYSQPKYQANAVKSYMVQNGVPSTRFFNISGRAYPDVASLGVNYQVFVGGLVNNVGGTSASTPCFAGVVALMNDARFKAGKKPLGFLNVWIYQHAGITPFAFFDITHGINTVAPCPQGFPASKGWDPISGFGVPNFAILKHLAVLK